MHNAILSLSIQPHKLADLLFIVCCVVSLVPMYIMNVCFLFNTCVLCNITCIHQLNEVWNSVTMSICQFVMDRGSLGIHFYQRMIVRVLFIYSHTYLHFLYVFQGTGKTLYAGKPCDELNWAIFWVSKGPK